MIYACSTITARTSDVHVFWFPPPPLGSPSRLFLLLFPLAFHLTVTPTPLLPLLFWPVSRGCGLAMLQKGLVHPPSPPILLGYPLHRCSCGGATMVAAVVAVAAAKTIAETSSVEAVAAALVHLVVRGRDIDLPRSTLPVRYSSPFLLCIIHGYPTTSAASLPVLSNALPSSRSAALSITAPRSPLYFYHNRSPVPGVPLSSFLFAATFPIRLSFSIHGGTNARFDTLSDAGGSRMMVQMRSVLFLR